MSKINKAKYAVLGVLSIKPASGYDIKTMMAKTTDHFWRESDSSIYPMLNQLEKDGLVVSELINDKTKKPKRLYTITEDGENELQEWLRLKPIQNQPRNELMLKLFFGWHVAPGVSLEHIKTLRHEMEINLKHLNEVSQKKYQKKLNRREKHQSLTLEAGIIYSKATVQWCDKVIAVLNDDKRK